MSINDPLLGTPTSTSSWTRLRSLVPLPLVSLLALTLTLTLTLALGSTIIITPLISSSLVLLNNTQAWSAFAYQNVSVDAFYLYNVSNAEAVVERGDAPVLVEVGPFSYREVSIKHAPRWSGRGGTELVDFHQQKEYVHVGGATELSPTTTTVTVASIAFGGVASTIGGFRAGSAPSGWWHALALEAVAAAGNSTYLTTQTVHDLLFGYRDPMLALLASAGLPVDPVVSLIHNVTKDEAMSSEHHWQMYTGTHDLSKRLEVRKWRGKRTVDFWGSPDCNRVHGRRASGKAPLHPAQPTVHLWTQQLFRSVPLALVPGSFETHGIPVDRYQVDLHGFANTSGVPSNSCYNQFGPSGVANLTAPMDGVPLFVSLPGFCGGDSTLATPFPNFTCNPAYMPSFEYDQVTGLLLRANLGLQYNVKLVGLPGIGEWQTQDPVVFPVFRLEQTASVSAAEAREWHAKVGPVSFLLRHGVAVGLAVAAVLLAILVVIVVRRRKQARWKGLQKDA